MRRYSFSIKPNFQSSKTKKIILGMSSILDLTGGTNYYIRREVNIIHTSDAELFKSDLKNIGKDMKKAVKDFETELTDLIPQCT